MNIKVITSSSIGVAIILFFAVNIVSNNLFQAARLDLTANNLYTLSEGTHNILASLDEPVILHFYLSKKLMNQLPY